MEYPDRMFIIHDEENDYFMVANNVDEIPEDYDGKEIGIYELVKPGTFSITRKVTYDTE